MKVKIITFLHVTILLLYNYIIFLKAHYMTRSNILILIHISICRLNLWLAAKKIFQIEIAEKILQYKSSLLLYGIDKLGLTTLFSARPRRGLTLMHVCQTQENWV